MMRNIFAFLFALFLSASVYAGIGFDGSIGYPVATITNPDDTKAHYSGLSLQGRFISPLIESGSFDLTLDLIGRYIDMGNTANAAAQRESGSQMGLGAGLTLRLGKVYLGADMIQARARHFFVGNKDEYLEYEMTQMSAFLGLRFQIGKAMSAALTYSQASAPIESKFTGLETNSKYVDTITWLHLTYETGQPLGKFFGDLFK
jgi:hypothetical protein